MATHLGINRLLHVVGLLNRAPAQQPVWNGVVLVRQDRPVLHHVRVFFRFEQHPLVGDNDNRLHHVGIVLGNRVVGEQTLDFLVLWGKVLAGHQAVVRQQPDLSIPVLADLLSRLKIGVLIARGDVHLAVNALLDALDHLVDADKLLNCHTHAVVNARAVGVKQEILGVDRHDFDGDAVFLHHTNSRLPRLTRNRLGGWLKDLLGLDDDLANASAVDFSHQLDLVDGLPNLVLLKILHQLGFKHLNVQRIAVYVF